MIAKNTFNVDAVRAAVAALQQHGSQRKAAKALGISQSTLSVRLKNAPKLGLEVETARKGGTPPLDADDKSRKIIHLQDEVSRLSRIVKDLHREADTAEIVEKLIGTVIDAPPNPPAWLQDSHRPRGKAEPEVPVALFSDAHVGEVVGLKDTNNVNEYNLAIAGGRYERFTDKLIMLARDYHTGNYPGIVLACLGDNVSGGIHDELKKTDEDDVIPCVIQAADWTRAVIKRAADHFGRVYIPWTCGNHGRLTIRPEFKKYYKKNWDFLLARMMQRDFADDKRVTIDWRPSNDVRFTVYGHRFLAAHGDMLGVKGGDGIIGSIGPIMRGEVKQSGQSSAMGYTFDTLIIGHWHQRLWLPRTIVNNALKGFDEFAMKALGAKPDRPTQALFFVHSEHGMTAHWNIYVEKNAAPPVSEWVSWQNQEEP